jgi:hypothetical protein
VTGANYWILGCTPQRVDSHLVGTARCPDCRRVPAQGTPSSPWCMACRERPTVRAVATASSGPGTEVAAGTGQGMASHQVTDRPTSGRPRQRAAGGHRRLPANRPAPDGLQEREGVLRLQRGLGHPLPGQLLFVSEDHQVAVHLSAIVHDANAQVGVKGEGRCQGGSNGRALDCEGAVSGRVAAKGVGNPDGGHDEEILRPGPPPSTGPSPAAGEGDDGPHPKALPPLPQHTTPGRLAPASGPAAGR